MKNQWIAPFALAVLSLAVSAWASYTVNDKDLSNRITVVETQQKNDKESILRIENDTREIRKLLSEFYHEYMNGKRK